VLRENRAMGGKDAGMNHNEKMGGAEENRAVSGGERQRQGNLGAYGCNRRIERGGVESGDWKREIEEERTLQNQSQARQGSAMEGMKRIGWRSHGSP